MTLPAANARRTLRLPPRETMAMEEEWPLSKHRRRKEFNLMKPEGSVSALSFSGKRLLLSLWYHRSSLSLW